MRMHTHTPAPVPGRPLHRYPPPLPHQHPGTPSSGTPPTHSHTSARVPPPPVPVRPGHCCLDPSLTQLTMSSLSEGPHRHLWTQIFSARCWRSQRGAPWGVREAQGPPPAAPRGVLGRPRCAVGESVIPVPGGAPPRTAPPGRPGLVSGSGVDAAPAWAVLCPCPAQPDFPAARPWSSSSGRSKIARGGGEVSCWVGCGQWPPCP